MWPDRRQDSDMQPGGGRDNQNNVHEVTSNNNVHLSV